MTKQSRLAEIFGPNFEWSKQDGCQIMKAILFLPFENRTKILNSDIFVRISNGKNKMAAHSLAIVLVLAAILF